MKLSRGLVIATALMISMAVHAGSGVGASVGGVPSRLGATTFTGSVTSTKACASGFVRVSPNYCVAVPALVQSVPGGNGPACYSDPPTFPSTAKVVRLLVALTVQSANAVGYRTAQVFFNPNGASGSAASGDAVAVTTAYEEVAKAAGTEIGAQSTLVDVPLSSGGQICFLKSMSSGTWARTQVLGYYD